MPMSFGLSFGKGSVETRKFCILDAESSRPASFILFKIPIRESRAIYSSFGESCSTGQSLFTRAVLLTKHYRNRRFGDPEFMLDFEEIYVIDSKTKSITRAKVVILKIKDCICSELHWKYQTDAMRHERITESLFLSFVYLNHPGYMLKNFGSVSEHNALLKFSVLVILAATCDPNEGTLSFDSLI
ncbi:hypothetical protein M9H77_17740 [Catharanthus roseus]|uniref:Uncharacterized protein n=1 Tax=Catharanthus roseus TaxID=4058 RepID=A0ACC0B5H9_CATRO|nr:hypothetical protein M9H77_17740 [Catharanthus roseus]